MSMADRDGYIWYDGKLVPWRSATTHVLTHSLHYGLAVFEGIRAYDTVGGTAIFRLTERKQPEINGFKVVRQRAKELWLTEQSGSAWNSLIARLKKNTPVQVDESHFLPLPVATEKPAGSVETTKP